MKYVRQATLGDLSEISAIFEDEKNFVKRRFFAMEKRFAVD